jgi:multiple sugar transport system substrate-binding protein
MAWGNPEQLALEEKLCNDFSRENPGIRVKFLRVPGSAYQNKMILMLASHTAPDIMRVDHYNFPSLVEKEYFLDLEPYAKADSQFHRSDYFPSAINECLYKGDLYALEVLFGGVILSYNKNLVRQAGLQDPFEVWKRGEWTWDKFREYAIKMTHRKPDGRYATFGTLVPPFPQSLIPVRQFGGEILDAEGDVALADGPAMKAWQMWHQFQADDHCAPTASQSANSAFSFESGKLGMEFSWIGTSVRYREVIKDFDWDICPVPKGPVSGATLLKGNQIVVSAETRHPKEAWKFIRFMTSERIERLLAGKLRRCAPTHVSYALSKDFLKSDVVPFNTLTFLDVLEHGKTLPINSRWGEWTDAFNSPVDAWIAAGEGDGQAALREGETRANAVLHDEEGF